MIGKLLGGRYEIIRRMGGGGFSDTYLAIDKQLPKTPWCVVKRLKSPESTDTEMLKTVKRLFDVEAAILYELGRKNSQIPRLLAHFQEDKEFYLVQEFIEGDDLSHEMVRGKQFNEAYVVTLLQDTLNVLKFVHHQNVIHRDIKPRNLIRRKDDGRIVLIDFGAVKQISTQVVSPQGGGLTTATIAIGTPGYMPNEQQGGKPRFSSDIYAVGMVAIQALTGLSAHELQDDPQTGEIVWREHAQVSPRLAAIIDQMVRTHFRDRYKSAEDVLADLQRLQKFAPTELGALATVPDNAHPQPQHYSGSWVLKAFNSRWVMASTALVLSLMGYTYWDSYSMPNSKATTAQVEPQGAIALSEEYVLSNTLPINNSVSAIATSPDGKTFVSGSADNMAKLWDLQTGELLRTFSGHSDEIISVIISPDGQTLASSSRDNTVKLWNLQTGELLQTLDHPDRVQSLAFSPDGKMLAAGNRNTIVFVWNAETGALLCDFEGHSKPVASVAISSDGTLLASGSEDKTIRVWSLKTEKRIHTLAQHASAVEAIAMSPDGQLLVSGGLDKTFVWSLTTGQVVRTLPDQSGFVLSTVVSPDGQNLISTHQDKTIKLWNLNNGELLKTLPGHSDWVSAIAVSPDGKTLVSGSRDKTIKIWRSEQ